MIQIETKSLCSGCGACRSACPKQCITMLRDAEGFLYPSVDPTQCVDCGICEKTCPIQNAPAKEVFETKAFAVINCDEDIRRQSSSGGVFTLLAQQILAEGGAVFGAAYDENLKVRHICVRDEQQLEQLRVSKYVQSEIGDTYRQAKDLLTDGKKVLFTGTPCQIAGLNNFLGRDYEGLLTHDIVCHGVPSPMVWETYLKCEEQKQGKKLLLLLRSKVNGWKNWHVSMHYVDGSTRTEPNSENPYMRGFLANLYLRPSCHACAFKGYERVSDLTLADFWGIEGVCPEMDDGKGTSLILVHSEKGEQVLRGLQGKLKMVEVDGREALKWNSAALESCSAHPKRVDFFRLLEVMQFDEAIKKCLTKPLLYRVARNAYHKVRSLSHLEKRGGNRSEQ